MNLNNGKKIICVADSSSAPEQGYIVERLISPLLSLSDAEAELELLKQHCAMDELRANACYRYYIDLQKKTVRFFEEHFNYQTERFKRGKEITQRYYNYLTNLKNGNNHG
jgi:hypothetical protein